MAKLDKFQVRDLRNGDWYWIHRIVNEKYASKIKPIGLAIYTELASCADTNGEAWPTHKTLATKLGISKRSIIRGIKTLCDHTLIHHYYEKGKGSHYQLLKVVTKTTSDKLSPVTNSHRTSDKLSPVVVTASWETNKNNKNKNKEQEVIPPPPLGSEGDVNAIIKLFEPINPSYQKLFKRVNQRNAVKELIEKHGYDHIARLISYLPTISLDRYCPRITTPIQLEDKLGELIMYIKRKGGRDASRIVKI